MPTMIQPPAVIAFHVRPPAIFVGTIEARGAASNGPTAAPPADAATNAAEHAVLCFFETKSAMYLLFTARALPIPVRRRAARSRTNAHPCGTSHA